MLFYLEQNIQDAVLLRDGGRRVISREVHFVEINAQGAAHAGGSAPYLDYHPATIEELAFLRPQLESDWLVNDNQEAQVSAYAVQHLIPAHLARVRQRREELVNKTLAAVQERLTKEINYWDRRARELKDQEQAGRPNAKINSARAQARADDLAERLRRRKEELELERQISASSPIIIGRALIVPIGALLLDTVAKELLDRQITEQIAMQAVMQQEIALGHDPKDVSAEKRGYDIESRDGQTGRLRFIEVKGRRAGADTITVTRNEILTALNTPEQFILALVEVDSKKGHPPYYVQKPFGKEPDFGVTSVNYDLPELIALSQKAE